MRARVTHPTRGRTPGRLAAAMVALAGTGAGADTVRWLELPCSNAQRSASWWDAAHWDGGAVPTSADDVVLSSPVLGDPAPCDLPSLVFFGSITTPAGEPIPGGSAECRSLSVTGGAFVFDLGDPLWLQINPKLAHAFGPVVVGVQGQASPPLVSSSLTLIEGTASMDELLVSGVETADGAGSARVVIGTEAAVGARRLELGSDSGATVGRLELSDWSSELRVEEDLIIGSEGVGVLEIRHGSLESGIARRLWQYSKIGADEGTRGEVLLNGYSSLWRSHEPVCMGGGGTASLRMLDGGSAHLNELEAAGGTSADTLIEVTGWSSELLVDSDVNLAGGTRLHVLDGGNVSIDRSLSAYASEDGGAHPGAEILVDGPGSWIRVLQGELSLWGDAQLIVSGGAMAWVDSLTADQSGAEVLVCGRGSVLLGDRIRIGGWYPGGSPTLRLSDEAEADVIQDVYIGANGRLELARSTRVRTQEFTNSGTVAGEGTIDLDPVGSAVYNIGLLSVGLDHETASTLRIRAGLHHAGSTSYRPISAIIGLDVFADGTTDRLLVEGRVSLLGDLNIAVHGSLRAGQRFEVLQADLVDGRFDRITSTGAGDGLALEAIYTPQSVAVAVIAIDGLELQMDQPLSVGGFASVTIHALEADRQLQVDAPIVWSTDDPSIAAVDATGVVHGFSSGTTLLRARAAGLEASIPVTVRPMPQPPLIERISVDTIGYEDEPYAIYASISGSGSRVAYNAGGTTEAAPSILVRDRAAGVTRPVDVLPGGGFSEGFSEAPALSRDGRWVLFRATGSNLVEGLDPYAVYGSFVLADLETGVLEAIGRELGNPLPSTTSGAISADGSVIALAVSGPSEIDPMHNGQAVYVIDRSSGQVERIAATSPEGPLPGLSSQLSITPDGRFVVFSVYDSSSITDSPTVGVFVHDRTTGLTDLIGDDWPDHPVVHAVFASSHHAISDDGRFVAFTFYVEYMDGVQPLYHQAAYVHDRLLGTRKLIAEATSTPDNVGAIYGTVISGDGRWVAFSSNSDALVPGDTNGGDDIFMADHIRGDLRRISLTFDGQQVEASSQWGVTLTPDGSQVAWSSSARNIAPFETDLNEHDIVLRRFLPGDYDRSGTVEIRDVLMFFEDFRSRRTWCDLTADGEIDILDLLAFFGRF